MLILANCGEGGSDASIDQESRLQTVTDWFISDGISGYYENPDMNTLTNRINGFGVYLGAEIVANKRPPSPYYTMLFVRADSHYSANVYCYSRLEDDSGKIYEYWVRKLGTSEHADIEFILTKALNMSSFREIVDRSPTFKESFTYDDGTTLVFPTTPKVISILLPDHYPAAFSGTVLEDKRAVFENGNWVLAD